MMLGTDILVWYLRGNDRARVFLEGVRYGPSPAGPGPCLNATARLMGWRRRTP